MRKKETTANQKPAMDIINRLVDKIIHHPKRLLAVILPLTLVFAYFYAQQTQNNHIEIFFEKEDPLFADYRAFQKTYGNEEFAVVALESDAIFSARSLETIRELTTALRKIDGVDRVVSLTNLEEFVGCEDAVMLREIVPPSPLSSEKAQEARRRAMANAFVRDNLISKDSLMTALHVELEPMNEQDKRDAVYGIIHTAERIAGKQFGIFCSGSSLIEVELNRLSELDFKFFVPVIIVLLFICIALIFRQMTLAVLCQVNLLVILVWAIGFFVMCGEQLNMITSAMGAILLAISIADSMHVLSHLTEACRKTGLEPVPAIRKTLTEVWFPCMFTSLTTGAGFISFYTSDIRPVAMLGLFTAVSVMFAFLLSVSFLPALMIVTQKQLGASFKKFNRRQNPSRRQDRFKRAIFATGRFTIRHRVWIFIFFILTMGLSIAGIFKIKFETNTFHYIHDSNRIKSDFMVIEDHFGGTIPFIVLIRPTAPVDFSDPEAVNLMDAVQAGLLREQRLLTHGFSIVDYVKEFNQAINSNDPSFYAIPDSRLDIADAYELGDPEVLDRILAPDRKEACLTFQSVWDSNESGYQLNAQASDFLKRKLGDAYDFNITGLSSLYLAMDKHLQESQIKSFFIAFVIIFLMMIFVCKNFWLSVLSMVPNLFPIIITLGLMGWVGVPLDVATTMIASVTIGIAVDDTIHFISWLRKNSGTDRDVGAAIVQAFADVGKPIVLTTLLLFIGFFVLVFGNILPTQMFGLLTAFSMVFALAGDIFILPALILIFKPKIPPLAE